MPGITRLSRRILAQNSGRDGERLALKLAGLRRDPFAFFRGTNPLFLEMLPRSHPLFRAPAVFVCGDLHLENFGVYKGDNRLCYFDINDFDEACLAPFTIDMVRFIACVDVAARGYGLGAAQSRRLARAFLEEYAAGIAAGKPRWIERSLAQGVFRGVLRRAMRRTRVELLDRLSRVKGGARRIRIDGAHAFSLDAADRPHLERLLRRLRRLAPGPRFFEWVDAARRIAGNGSLGLDRFILLVRGRGSPDGNFALDLKLAAPSAVAEWLRRPQPKWTDEAARVVSIQRTMQAIGPALLHPVEYRRRHYVLKELQPSIDRLALADWQGSPRRFRQAVEGMGRVAAWAHLRSCGRRGTATVEDLQAYVAGRAWRTDVTRLARKAAAGIRESWRTYSKDYDSGAVTAALAARVT